MSTDQVTANVSRSNLAPGAPGSMNPTRRLHDLGQRFWLDNITRDMPNDGTLKAFADHGHVGGALPRDAGDCDSVLARFADAGFDLGTVARRLQNNGAASFVTSRNDLLACIASKRAALRSVPCAEPRPTKRTDR